MEKLKEIGKSLNKSNGESKFNKFLHLIMVLYISFKRFLLAVEDLELWEKFESNLLV